MLSSKAESEIIRDKEIAIGEAIPSDFVGKTVYGRTVNIPELSMSNPVVMIFVPGYKEGLKIKLDAFWGCTPESCAFRSARDEFSECNVSVFILTGQSQDKIMEFIRENGFVTDGTEEVSGNYFTIIPDDKLTITKGLGVGYHNIDDEEFANRETLYI